MNILLLLLAILPGLIISYLIYQQDRYDREPRLVLLICFGLGMLITVPAMQMQKLANHYGWDTGENFWMLIVLSYIVVGFTEEIVKFISLYLYPYRHKAFDEPLDGIVYSVMIGMGFATLENILYANHFGMQTILFRAFTAVPAHGAFAVIMGYYAGLAKFDQKRRYQLLAIGVLLAIFLHGTYDFFILQEYYEWLMILATLTLCISLYFSIRMIRLHLHNSPFKNRAVPPESPINIPEKEELPESFSTAVENNVENEIMRAVLDELSDEEE
ncbi:MAG: PrsW family glutamic-type intramembrane protease [Bacteroidota bacterium]